MTPAGPGRVASRLRGMYDDLFSAYGPQGWWPAETSFEVIVGAYLTQNTAWKSVERSLANLRSAGIVSFTALQSVPVDRLQELIRPSGFITRKAPAMKAFATMLETDFKGSLELMATSPTAVLRPRLLELPGVGPETADAILLYALGHAVPVADEYLRRIAERHSLLPGGQNSSRQSYDSLVRLTGIAFAKDPSRLHVELYREFHALVVAVGKNHCGKTPRCDGCPLSKDLRHSSLRTRAPRR